MKTDDVRRFFTDRSWREECVAAYASVGILVFLTSFFWAPSRDFMHVVYVLAFFAPVSIVLLLRRPRFLEYGGWFTVLGLAYAAWSASSTLWSPQPRPDTFGLHFVFLAVWLAGTSWLAVRKRLDLVQAGNILTIVGAIASIIYQLLFHLHSYPLGYATEWGTRLGLFGWGVPRNPNTIGIFFGVTTIFAYLRWLSSSGWRKSLAASFLLVLNILPVIAAQSRGVWVSLAFVLPLAFWLHQGKSRKWLPHVITLIATGGAVLVSGYHEDLLTMVSKRTSERSDRLEIWSHVLSESREKHLWTGTGLVKHSRIVVPEIADYLPSVHHAHNSYFDALYRTGLMGLLLLLAHMTYVFAHWSRSPTLLPLFLWLLLGCLVSLVANPSFFWYLDAIWWNYWIPVGLIAATVLARQSRTETAP
jgi:O-antigen ligase